MNRREALLTLAATSTLGFGLSPRLARAQVIPLTPLATGFATTSLNADIYYEVHGNPAGPNLFLAQPIVPTGGLWTAGYLPYFTDKYRVLIADYPYSGRSDALPNPALFTAQQVADDYLAIADAAGMTQFAIAGYSWGANSALQLATRTSRLTALAVGGWPALGGPYADLLETSQQLAALDILHLTGADKYVTYYQSLLSWPESAAVAALSGPRLNYVDSRDNGAPLGIQLGNLFAGSTDLIGPFRANRATLDALGWQTVEVQSYLGHTGGLLPSIACPVIRAFLDTYL
jgi:pimeloyl-ACP methyl ester carboxylesterase